MSFKDTKTYNKIIKVTKINILPLVILITGGLIEKSGLQATFGFIYEILYGLAIIAWIFLFISIPYSVFYIIGIFIEEFILKKTKK